MSFRVRQQPVRHLLAMFRAPSHLVLRRRVLHDVRVYAETPSAAEEVALGEAAPDWRDLADDTDWDAEWRSR